TKTTGISDVMAIPDLPFILAASLGTGCAITLPLGDSRRYGRRPAARDVPPACPVVSWAGRVTVAARRPSQGTWSTRAGRMAGAEARERAAPWNASGSEQTRRSKQVRHRGG